MRIAKCAVAALVAATVLAGPAMAAPSRGTDACAADPSPTTCKDDLADRTIAALEWVRWYVDDRPTTGDPLTGPVCPLYEITTGKPCPPLLEGRGGADCTSDPGVLGCFNEAITLAEAAVEDVRDDPCLDNPNVPTCVNDVGARGLAAFELIRTTYNDTVRPLGETTACDVYTLATGKPCPGFLPTL